MHRLDRDASGLVLFAARAEACASLQTELNAGRIDRRYIAVVAGHLERPEGRICLRIARDSTDPRRRIALPENAPAGLPASTRFRVLGRSNEEDALDLALDTGRTHQLRVHLAAVGHAIVGDRFYGGSSAPRLCLHACKLTLTHPFDGRPVVASSPVPNDIATRMPALTFPVG
jgi:tRNA pseudouridine32 synthase/23S rRNA pseudouridine746 synthase